MKKIVFLSVFLFGAINLMFAQQKFNVQNGTKAEFYDDLETAIQKAASGDTIYLPGKAIQVQNDLIIDKKLAIIGAGCDVDSVGGLQTTEIKIAANSGYATINYRNGSDGSLLMGCIVGTIQFGHNNEFNESQQNIENITITRNWIKSSIILGLSASNNNVKQIIISENIIEGSGIGIGASNCIINNNLCNNLSGLNNSRIYNNVIRGYYSAILNDLKSCIIENNFFGETGNNTENCIFNNNAFIGNIDVFPAGTNSGSNNLMNQESIKTFKVNDLSLPKNLAIRDDSPCKNAGTDGTDIGIFGGPAPYKAGAVPSNPHIDKALISAQTDKDGKLKVDIKVSAQNR